LWLAEKALEARIEEAPVTRGEQALVACGEEGRWWLAEKRVGGWHRQGWVSPPGAGLGRSALRSSPHVHDEPCCCDPVHVSQSRREEIPAPGDADTFVVFESIRKAAKLQPRRGFALSPNTARLLWFSGDADSTGIREHQQAGQAPNRCEFALASSTTQLRSSAKEKILNRC